MSTSIEHVRWPSIENFHSLRKILRDHPEFLGDSPQVQYRAKVKLHGTNVGIHVFPDGQVVVQGRNRLLSTAKGQDECGFAQWAATGPWAHLSRWERELVVFGEWCGPRIHNGMALNRLPDRVFAVFSILERTEEGWRFIVEPREIQEIVGEIPQTHVLPWYHDESNVEAIVEAWHTGAYKGKELHEALGMSLHEYGAWACRVELPGQRWVIDWAMSAEGLVPVLEPINALVQAVEACDPWVKKIFGIEGMGEGLVFYPDRSGLENFAQLAFKAKGKEHRMVAAVKPLQPNPEAAATAPAFAELVVTEARLEQGLREIFGEDSFDLSQIGVFLAWITKDVRKECQAELEVSGLAPKVAMAACVARAKQWYMRRLGA